MQGLPLSKLPEFEAASGTSIDFFFSGEEGGGQAK